ncbi:MAG: hypothetical protein ACQEQI_06920 [Bacillota bacterium]
MARENNMRLDQANMRLAYLEKLKFTKDLVLDLLPADKAIKLSMEEVYSTLDQLIQLLESGVESEQRLSQAYQLIEDNDLLTFIYSATEDEIYLKVTNEFNLQPDYQWQLLNKIYHKLHYVSDRIDYLNQMNREDVSEIQKLFMEVAVIFNNNLSEELHSDKYLTKHLNALYHDIKGDFNQSLYNKGTLDVTGEPLERAKNEYRQALKFDQNLTRAEKKLKLI